ncbi:MAG: extracellular solute-binding protein [bacterium]|nr:extracellular solute-binding protein [bacterium]
MHIGPWDLVLILVVSVQATVVAYVAAPRVKSIFLTLPLPFTAVALAVGLPLDAANVLSLLLLLGYMHGVRLLHDRLGLPILAAIPLSLAGYCVAGWLAVGIVPSGPVMFWSSAAGMLFLGAFLFWRNAPRAERTHRTRLPVWQKLPAVLAVVLLLVVVKQELRGFATLFPLVSVVGAYEARYCLWTLSLTVPLLMLTLVPLMAVAYLAQDFVGLPGGLALGWLMFLLLLIPLIRWQWRRWPAPLAVLPLVLLPALAPEAAAAEPTHAIGIHGQVKYGPDFTHFDYTNPNAPKGGEVRLAVIGSFDNLNPFILKGVAAAGTTMLYTRLCEKAQDEPLSEYGHLAQSMELAPDRSAITFFLRPEARWHDGVPVTADDVVFAFYALVGDGIPFYRAFYADVDTVIAVDAHTVRFELAATDNRELPVVLGQLRALPRHYWEGRDFAATTLDPPLGSGPYRIESIDPGRSITYTRVVGNWDEDLPVRRGQDNFERIRFDYYRDDTVALEALKAGEYDFRAVGTAREWATAYDHPAVDDGRLVLSEIPNHEIRGMSGFVFNTRRSKFSDPQVRRALAYAFDFEWTNATLFHGFYTRTESNFANSELAATGLPDGREGEILEDFRGRVPEEVFTTAYHAPTTDGHSGSIRANLRVARRMLRDAGWSIDDGRLVNAATGAVMELEFLLARPSYERVIGPMQVHLQRLGIHSTIRTVDGSQYWNRLQAFDYDIVVRSWNQYLSPGNEQRNYWSSSSASAPGSRNYAGINDPVVDELVERLIAAQTRTEQIATARALDRVLLWGHYVIPNWHTDLHRLAYWNKFGRPDVVPLISLGFPETWWAVPASAAAP